MEQATVKATLDGLLLHPSDYLAAVEFKGRDVTLTIKDIEFEDLRKRDDSTERKPVLSFEERPRKLVLNVTCASTIAGIHGTEARNWIGKRITLYPTKTIAWNQEVDCIRVRAKDPGPKQNGNSNV